jgi:DNA-binding NarL/FixJ family response regulator
VIKVLIADDHAIVRKGLKQILYDTDDMTVAGEASSGQEVLEKTWNNDYNVVVLDISMPGRGGLEILKELKNRNPELHVLVLSIHPEELYAKRVLKTGADGYLSKHSAPDELIKAIRRVSSGGKYLTDSLAEKLALDLQDSSEDNPHSKLSDREYQVMLMIASGKTVMEISRELSLSDKTISTYKSRVMEKTGLKNNAELIRYVIEHKLLE